MRIRLRVFAATLIAHLPPRRMLRDSSRGHRVHAPIRGGEDLRRAGLLLFRRYPSPHRSPSDALARHASPHRLPSDGLARYASPHRLPSDGLARYAPPHRLPSDGLAHHASPHCLPSDGLARYASPCRSPNESPTNQPSPRRSPNDSRTRPLPHLPDELACLRFLFRHAEPPCRLILLPVRATATWDQGACRNPVRMSTLRSKNDAEGGRTNAHFRGRDQVPRNRGSASRTSWGVSPRSDARSTSPSRSTG